MRRCRCRRGGFRRLRSDRAPAKSRLVLIQHKARAAAALGTMALAGAAWGVFEAGWVRRRVLEVELPGLDPVFDGLRIAHLSDFHLGPPSRGRVATERAVDWVAARQPDLVCVTGDLVSHPRGEPLFRVLLQRLGRPFVVLGNHDVAVSRDPFSRTAELDDLREEAVLLRDEAAVVELRGRRVQLVGLDPLSYRRSWRRAAELTDPHADLRVLLCHFPGIARRLAPGTFDLILAGHVHDGQISIPYPGGKMPLINPGAPELAGIYRYPAGVLHVSPGLGTTLVPFRFCARPEVTELVLRRGDTGATDVPTAGLNRSRC
jgi:hypothetical protein